MTAGGRVAILSLKHGRDQVAVRIRMLAPAGPRDTGCAGDQRDCAAQQGSAADACAASQCSAAHARRLRGAGPRTAPAVGRLRGAGPRTAPAVGRLRGGCVVGDDFVASGGRRGRGTDVARGQVTGEDWRANGGEGGGWVLARGPTRVDRGRGRRGSSGQRPRWSSRSRSGSRRPTVAPSTRGCPSSFDMASEEEGEGPLSRSPMNRRTENAVRTLGSLARLKQGLRAGSPVIPIGHGVRPRVQGFCSRHDSLL